MGDTTQQPMPGETGWHQPSHEDATVTKDWLAARAAATPHQLALITAGQAWTYGQLDRQVARLAGGLAAQGMGRGDIVAMLLPNGPDAVFLVHAAARLGAILAPLNTRLSAPELSWQLEHLEAKLLVYNPQTAGLAHALGRASSALVQASALTAHSAPPLAGQRPLELSAAQAIVFTSGTTGQPKGAVLTFANHFWSATASSYRLGLHRNDCWLSALPLYHVGGLAVLFRSCLYGTSVVLHDRFDPAAFSQSMDRNAITMMSMVPTMLHRLLAHRPGPWPASLRLVLLGGAPASPALLEACRQQGIPLAPTYGLTEAASQVATMAPDRSLSKPGSVGAPLMFTSVRVVDDREESVPVGTWGEILVSGPTVMAGYHRDPLATAAAVQNGELHTGDIGFLDEDGDLWLVQRRRDIIISGGENVYPAEVEAVLEQHEAVARACVVGIPDDEWGERVAALVELKAPAAVSAEVLLAFARQRLAGYKLPRLTAFTDALPLTASGKVQRQAVTQELMAATREHREKS